MAPLAVPGINVVPARTLFHFQRPVLMTRALKLAGLTRHIYVAQREGESWSVAAQALPELIADRATQERDILNLLFPANLQDPA